METCWNEDFLTPDICKIVLNDTFPKHLWYSCGTSRPNCQLHLQPRALDKLTRYLRLCDLLLKCVQKFRNDRLDPLAYLIPSPEVLQVLLFIEMIMTENAVAEEAFELVCEIVDNGAEKRWQLELRSPPRNTRRRLRCCPHGRRRKRHGS